MYQRLHNSSTLLGYFFYFRVREKQSGDVILVSTVYLGGVKTSWDHKICSLQQWHNLTFKYFTRFSILEPKIVSVQAMFSFEQSSTKLIVLSLHIATNQEIRLSEELEGDCTTLSRVPTRPIVDGLK
jgi:hypothetical protein